MKKSLTLLAGLFVGVLCFAQKLSDTEVQIIAYWDKGDIMVYDFTDKQTTTVNGEDVNTRSATEKHIVEVIGATDNSYLLRFSFEDIFNNPVVPGASLEVAQRITENMWFDTLTDELGTVQDLANIDATLEAIRATVPVMTDRVLAKYTAQELKEEGVTRDGLIQAFTQGLCREEFLEKIYEKYLLPLLRYHGARFNLDQEITVSQELVEVWGYGNVEVDWKFWVESKECTEEYAVIRSYAKAEKEALAPILKQVMLAGDPSLTPAELDELVAGMDAQVEEYSSLLIHLESGWPLQWASHRITTLAEDGESTVITNVKELVFSEDDPRNE